MRSILDTFDANLDLSLKTIQYAQTSNSIPTQSISLVTEAAFVRMFVAWEEFLESSFIHYGMGNPSLNNNLPKCYAQAPDEDHLKLMLIGSSRFMDWSTLDTVRKTADLYFENGDPYTDIFNGSHQPMQDIKTVRNAVAHITSTTTTRLESLYKRWTGQPFQGDINAYEVIMASKHDTKQTFLGYTNQTLSTLGQLISHY